MSLYTFVTYTPTFLRQEGGLSLSQAYLVTWSPADLRVLTPLIGRLSDRSAGRPLLLVHAGGFSCWRCPSTC